MGLIKDIGKLAGSLAGLAVSLPIELAAEVVRSEFLKEIGESVYKVTEHTGELLGNVAEGVGETVYGIATSDSTMQNKGFEKVFDSGATYVNGVAKGVGKMVVNGVETVEAIIDGDTDKAITVGKELVKTAAVATFAVSITDVVDDIGFFDDDDTVQIVENPNTHHVTPHTRVYNGKEIWVDGDGDTSVDTYRGWEQHNPNYRA